MTAITAITIISNILLVGGWVLLIWAEWMRAKLVKQIKKNAFEYGAVCGAAVMALNPHLPQKDVIKEAWLARHCAEARVKDKEEALKEGKQS